MATTEKSSGQQRREAGHRGEERGATQQGSLDVREGNKEGNDAENHDGHEDEVVALALVLLGCQLLLLADERGLAVDGTGVATGLRALVLGREVLVGHGGLLMTGRGSVDDRLAADGQGSAGAGFQSLIEALVALAGDYGMGVPVPEELRPKMKGSSAMAKALRTLDALPAAPMGLAREAGAALSAIVSRRADGGGPTSG